MKQLSQRYYIIDRYLHYNPYASITFVILDQRLRNIRTTLKL